MEFVDFNSNAEVLSISFSDDVPHSVVISDDGVLDNGKSRLLIDGLHEIDFRNPSQSLRIHATTPGSSVVYSGVDSGFIASFDFASPQIAIDANNADLVYSKNRIGVGSALNFSIIDPGTEITIINEAAVSAQGTAIDDLIAVEIFDQEVFVDFGNFRTLIPRSGFHFDGLEGKAILVLQDLRVSSTVLGIELNMESGSMGNLTASFGNEVDDFLITFDQIHAIEDDFEAESRTYSFANVLNEVELSSEGDHLRISTLEFSCAFTAPTQELTINGGESNDLLTIDAFGFVGSMMNLTVNAGSGDDEIYLKRSSAAQTNLNGDAGNDFIRVGEPSLSGVLGSVVVDGGEHDTTRTETQVIAVNGEVVEREKTVGDRLEVFGDDVDATAIVSVTGNSVGVSSHSGAITFAQIETTIIQNAIAGNRVNVIETNDDQNVVVFGGDNADAVAIAGSGNNSFVDVFVGGGDDIIEVENTGMGSWLNIWTYDGNDELVVNQSGENSVVNIETGIGNDRPWIQDTGENSFLRIATDDGDDALILNGTGVGSRTEYFAGAGNERVLVSSVVEHTTYIKGDVWLRGEDDGPAGSSDRTGDGLEFYYSSESEQQNLSLGESTFQRTESDITGVVHFEGWESIFVYASEMNDVLRVSGTANGSFVDARLVGGDDELIVESTGDGSVLSVATGGGKDTADISSTGVDSQFQICTEVAPDEYQLPFGDESVLIRSSGENSRVGVVTGRGEDTVTVLTTGVGSETQIATGQASDLIDLRGSGAGSTTFVQAGEANDRIIISSDTAVGYAISGSYLVYGDEDDETSTSETTINSQGQVISRSYSEGDKLDLFFNAVDDPREYRLEASTFSRVDDQNTESIAFDGIESLFAAFGGGDDFLTVMDTAVNSLVDVRMNGGDDKLVVEQTGENSLLYVETDDGADYATIRSTGVGSLTRLFTYETSEFDGDDRVTVVKTGIESGLEIATGSGEDQAFIESTATGSILSIILGGDDDLVNLYSVGGPASIRASEGDDTVNVFFAMEGVRDVGFEIPEFGVLIHGDEGNDSLVLQDDQSSFDLADSRLNIAGFEQLQRTGVTTSPIMLNAETVKAIAPDGGELMIDSTVSGGLSVTDSDKWRMAAPVIRNGKFLLRASYSENANIEIIIAVVVERPWKNMLISEDVNGDGKPSALDALIVINELNASNFSTESQLRDPVLVTNWLGLYYDVTGDGRVTALDALVIINKLNLIDSEGASEDLDDATDLVPYSPMTTSKPADARNFPEPGSAFDLAVDLMFSASQDGFNPSQIQAKLTNVTTLTSESEDLKALAVDELLSNSGFFVTLWE